ncbi:MAG: tetratricopeptide repeat protein, partial [Candidatus Nanopelagicales bacterium]
DLGHPGKARDLHQRALTIQEHAYGPDHPQVAATLTNLGNALFELGATEDAATAWLRAQRIFQESLPADHPYHALVQRQIRKLAPEIIQLPDGTVLRANKPESDE